jgi:hypothetical protein
VEKDFTLATTARGERRKYNSRALRERGIDTRRYVFCMIFRRNAIRKTIESRVSALPRESERTFRDFTIRDRHEEIALFGHRYRADRDIRESLVIRN